MGKTWPDIKAVVLDKDNCFAVKRGIYVYKPYKDHFKLLREAYPGPRLLIVSNSAGTDRHVAEADIVEETTGVKVFRHSTKKPGCGQQVLEHFRSFPEIGVSKPSEIAVVGDRLFTDVLMANLMGAFSVWVKNGVFDEKGLVSRLEKGLVPFLTSRGFKAPAPDT
ncbi:MAG: hypothetical protein OHK93_008709 [Ramalina farinacea]|uniref:Uncharacterized protein n=1 Tax=Ramalina farinacea TaxID=258253 RepID=A0AA43QQT7_9LECA|nr:hypothetical protein [Ramalina farinacea]